jgi:hypothetical protein
VASTEVASRDQAQKLALPDERLVDLVLRLTKPGEDAHRTRRRRYDHSYEVYRASERRPRSLEPWQSKLRTPYAMQVLDTALVNIQTGAPRVQVRPRHPDVELNAKAMQVVMDYYVGEDHLVEKQPWFAQQGLIYGVTVAKNHWLFRSHSRNTRSWIDDQGNATVRPQVRQVETVVRDGPTMEVWNIYDAWWDPQARDVDNAAYIVLRSWFSKEQLLRDACTTEGNHERTDCNGIYHNIPELLKTGPTVRQDVSAQERFLTMTGPERGAPITQQSQLELFEVMECWTDDVVSVIGNRKVLMRNDPNPYWHGNKPIVIAQTRPDLFEMQGIPETELVDHLQQAQWTLQNMTIDNLHLTTMRGITYREGGVADPNALQLRPRFKWPVVDHDDIRPFEIPPISSDVYQERSRLLSDMQLVTGINPYISGADLATIDQNTATGVTALQEVASRLLRFKASMLQYKGYQRTFEMWGDMIQQFMDKDVSVQVTGMDGQPLWLNVSPRDVAGHFNYILEGSEESLSRQQARGEAIALLNAFAPLAQLGFINFKPILEKVAVAYDFADPEQLFVPPQPQPQPPAAAPTQEQIDAANRQSQQQQPPPSVSGDGSAPRQNGGAPSDQLFTDVMGPRVGDVYGARSRPVMGGVPLDPQLAAALSRIRPF